MRIAVFCGGTYLGGTEVVALTIARELRARGHDARMLTSAWTNGDFPRRLDESAIPYQPVHFGKISLTLRSPYLAWTAAAILRLPTAFLRARRWLRAFDPQVVLINNREVAFYLAPLLRRRVTIFYMHEVPPVTPRTRHVFGLMGRAVDHFVAVCDSVRVRLLELGVPAGHVSVVHNGAARAAAAPPSPRSSTTPMRVGIVGQVVEYKGHEDLLTAVALLRRRGIDLRCVIAGKGDPAFTARLHDHAEREGIADVVEWRGFTEDVDAVFADIDVSVVPSRHEEAFPMTAVEASLAGLPVIATRSGGLPEVVVDGETGFVVPRREPAQIAAAIERLYRDAHLRHRLGTAGRVRALQRFTAKQMVDGVESLCQTLVAAQTA